MAERALKAADDAGLDIEVMDRPDLEELGMGAFLGVAQGSKEPPKLIVMRYEGDPENADNNLAIVGKGITFDSGGISIKPSANMGDMKGDMAGGAAVISAMKVIGQVGPKINVTGIVAATENMPGGGAQRPGDIVTTMSGKTIEIDNTDAEGRLVLADAVYYARSQGIRRIVDIATLTGAMSIALGHICSGLFGNDQGFIDQVKAVGRHGGRAAVAASDLRRVQGAVPQRRGGYEEHWRPTGRDRSRGRSSSGSSSEMRRGRTWTSRGRRFRARRAGTR